MKAAPLVPLPEPDVVLTPARLERTLEHLREVISEGASGEGPAPGAGLNNVPSHVRGRR